MADKSHQGQQPFPKDTRTDRTGAPFLIALLALAYAAPAHAYLDPGTGSILLQGLLAAIATLGLFWQRVKVFFSSMFASRKPDTEEAGEDARSNPQE